MMMTAFPTPPPTPTPLKEGWVNFATQRKIYVLISILLGLPGLVFLIWNQVEWGTPLKLGIDYVGGTLIDYSSEKPLAQSDVPQLRATIEGSGLAGSTVQLRSLAVAAKPSDAKASTPAAPASTQQTLSLRLPHCSDAQIAAMEAKLKAQTGSLHRLQRNSVGPTLAAEIFRNGLLALGVAYLLITGYLTYRFQLDYALCALVALLHDSLFVVGTFAILGRFLGMEIDALFVTGMLTVIGFSVHDTIVVYDRLRENTRVLYSKKLSFLEMANIAVNQTLARSINTSLTALLPLIALFFFGGDSTRSLVLCMGLGILVGTYSSIFVASAMLTWWRERAESQPLSTAGLV